MSFSVCDNWEVFEVWLFGAWKLQCVISLTPSLFGNINQMTWLSRLLLFTRIRKLAAKLTCVRECLHVLHGSLDCCICCKNVSALLNNPSTSSNLFKYEHTGFDHRCSSEALSTGSHLRSSCPLCSCLSTGAASMLESFLLHWRQRVMV